MTEIYLHNTKSRKKELFEPIDAENVRMYVCGPTVYDRAHMGNARAVVVFDVLYRLLRQVYGAEHVTYARNFTDVDDKINARAAETGRTIGEITAETTQWYLDDMAALCALEPDQMPRATAYIPQMVTMIEELIEKGHAYAAEGHVLFAVDSWKEGYGKLSGRSVDDMIAGARVEVAPYKKNPMDFVLWKPSDEGLPGWESPWGRGRPGWHIECSAMSFELFGSTFDIHGGGNDLMFPHHENEIAQSCCAHPEGEFARFWLHNEMLQVEGKKMSKSLGNFFTVRDLLDQGVPGPVIRFVMLETHYRKPMDWTEAKKKNAARALDALVSVVVANPDLLEDTLEGVELDAAILDAVADDLNTSLAMTRLKAMGKTANDPRNFPDYDAMYAAKRAVIVAAGFLGFDLVKMAKDRRAAAPNKDLGYFQSLLAHAYVAAKESKDFSEVDRLKAAYVDAGLKVQISREGIEVLASDDLDQSKLEALK